MRKTWIPVILLVAALTAATFGPVAAQRDLVLPGAALLPGAAAQLPQTAAGNNGFGLATVVMILLIGGLIYAFAGIIQASRGGYWPVTPPSVDVLIPLLAVAELGVAFYLTYVETQHVAAVCGPVGDCNTVQSSPYARLFGFLPVGLVGMAGTLAVLATWLLGRFGRGWLGQIAPLLLFGGALFGVLFCTYLTYLELAVIHAVCIWCLSVAVMMTLILVLSVGPALDAMAPPEETGGTEAAL